ncbi:MAG TPA: group I intron-associated PD-(D/E)XK endonuclease [Kribbella sp.]|uniref:group I intron-associated PD-(D/E)XK endonuclease n=1 Tax=Kribbella sp. TaxID=1871183 RepID=UPI002D795ED2|nr:group I intron-associated PD-(D/E)XK endonuclease [Kribbella sp.]HET6299207.1 group I intron-associated PD-(D/E)XK endonuclease [Kribbella sp.]
MTATRGRPRRWTDEQLTDAIASQRSWHGVLRALGFAATSGNALRTVKRVAQELELDTSHFTGQRRWTDSQLRQAILQAATWADVLRALDRSDNSEMRRMVKAHSVRLGLDASHLLPDTSDEEPGDDAFTSGAQRQMLRVAAPSIAAAWFTLRGMSVAAPIEPEVYDLLVTMDEGIQRVQVKSTTRRTASGSWTVEVGRRPYTLDKSAGKAPYDPEELDIFFIVDGLGRIFVIPSRVLAGRVAITIDSYAEYCVGDASSLLG